MNIALMNSVILNGGDAGIVYGIKEGISTLLPEARLHVFAKQAHRAVHHYPRLEPKGMIGDRWPPGYLGKVLRMTYPTRSRLCFLTSHERDFLNDLKSMDAVIYCGGGYINDFYDCRVLFSVLRQTLALGIPHFAYAHSTGPFFREETRKAVSALFNRFEMVTVRDEATSALLKEIGVVPAKICFTADAAFAMKVAQESSLSPEDRSELNLIADFKTRPPCGPLLIMSVREWLFPGQEKCTHLQEEAKANLKRFIHLVLEKTPFRICFLSTCQGRPGYRYDDSIFAASLIQDLPVKYSTRVMVSSHPFHPSAYPLVIGRCADFVIGMRMHFIIFSIMAEVPFVAIAYERKTHELAKTVGLSRFCHDLAHLEPDDLFMTMRIAYANSDMLRTYLRVCREWLGERSLQNARIFFNVVSRMPPQHGCDPVLNGIPPALRECNAFSE